jgi:hypothetical protein
MNERIRELANQATTVIEATEHSGEDWIFNKEKFAELIVKECIDYCGENLSKTVGGALKIHFGVEK